MSCLKNKKILFLEGESMLIPLLERAKELGIYTVIANWYSVEEAPAKLVADKHYEVDFSDMSNMLKIIKDEGIDGIFTAFTDSHLEVYQKICYAAGLPCFTTETLWEIMVNKAIFKKYCCMSGLPVVDEYSLDDIKRGDCDIRFPVIIKPVDNSGSRGISICKERETLMAAVDRALEFSQVKDVVIERYLRADYALADFIISDGKAYFCASSDKPVNDDNKDYVNLPGGYMYPSKYDEIIKSRLTEAVQNFVNLIGYKNGILCLELIVEDGKIYVIEPQFRYGGKFQDVFIRKETGVDEIELLFHLAVYGNLGADMADKELDLPFKRNYVLMNLLIGEGEIGSIPSFDDILAIVGDSAKLYVPRKKVGEYIKPDGSVVQMFGKVILEADTRAELIDKMRCLQQNLQILNTDGENMVISSIGESYC